VPGREIYHLLRQAKPDMAAERMHGDSRRSRVTLHARICLHSDQNNAQVRVFSKGSGASPRGLQPRVFAVESFEFVRQVKLQQGLPEGALDEFMPGSRS
jgi:hypothetical protein